MAKYLVTAVIALLLIFATACQFSGGKELPPETSSDAGSTAPTGPSAPTAQQPSQPSQVPDLGTLGSCQFSFSGGLANDYYEARVERDAEGKLWFYEIPALGGWANDERVGYRYAMQDDALERIEKHLKEQGLWVSEPFPSPDPVVMDGLTYSWGFSTEQGYFNIYNGMGAEASVSKRLHELTAFVEALRGNAAREKDPATAPLKPEDIVGIQLQSGSRSAMLLSIPGKQDFHINSVGKDVANLSYEELLEQVLAKYKEAEGKWGAEIWDRYPLAMPSGAEVAEGYYRLALLVRQEEEPDAFRMVSKLNEYVSKDAAAWIESILELLQSHSK